MPQAGGDQGRGADARRFVDLNVEGCQPRRIRQPGSPWRSRQRRQTMRSTFDTPTLTALVFAVVLAGASQVLTSRVDAAVDRTPIVRPQAMVAAPTGYQQL